MISNIMMVKILKDEAGKLKFVFDEDNNPAIIAKGRIIGNSGIISKNPKHPILF